MGKLSPFPQGPQLMAQQIPPAFWSIPGANLLEHLETTPKGLSAAEGQKRLLRYGPNLLKPKRRTSVLALLLSQFKSPIILILLFATALSSSSLPRHYHFISGTTLTP
jgi:magnesium-transporting ATPase (P-type)